MQPPLTAAICMRSLGEALTSALATFALFAASNWGSVHILGVTERLSHLMVWQAFYAFCFPQLGLYTSVLNAIQVWMVKRALTAACRKVKRNYPHIRCVAIMAVCPLFIEVQESGSLLYNLRTEADGALYEYHELKSKWCPLELWVAARNAGKDLPEDAAATAQAYEAVDATPSYVDDAAVPLPKYIKVEHMEDKLALMVAGLVPNLEDLSYLRSRNWFHWAVTAVQACGYLLSILERLTQHLPIAPIEAILSFLCLIVALQLSIELYACSNYQRPLLLRLTPQQVSYLNHTLHTYSFNFVPSPRNEALIRMTLLNLPVLLISMPLIYYVYHYVHVSFMSSLAVLLFLLAMPVNSFKFTKKVLFGSHLLGNWDFEISITPTCRLSLTCVFTVAMCISGLVLALVATIQNWHTFHTPTLNWFAWALPHS